MFKKILLMIGVSSIFFAQNSWAQNCLEPNIDSSYVQRSSIGPVVLSPSTPDGGIVETLDITIPFALNPCESATGGLSSTIAVWLNIFTGTGINNAGPALAGSPGYFAVNGIPGLYYQIVNPNNTAQTAKIAAADGSGGQQIPSVMGGSNWVDCPDLSSLTSCSAVKTVSEYKSIPLRIRINFIKNGSLVPGTYDINNQYLFHFNYAAIPVVGLTPGFGMDTRLNAGILIFQVKNNCELDTSSTNLSVDFGEFDDEGVAVGQRLVPYDKDFEIGFHGCADSVLPAISWNENPGDSLDLLGNFPTFTSAGGSAGIGFKIFDKSAGQFTPITPGLQRTLTDIAANVVVDGKMRYPATQTTVRWPFAVRLIKSGTVPLGTFSGRATFTVAYP